MVSRWCEPQTCRFNQHNNTVLDDFQWYDLRFDQQREFGLSKPGEWGSNQQNHTSARNRSRQFKAPLSSEIANPFESTWIWKDQFWMSWPPRIDDWRTCPWVMGNSKTGFDWKWRAPKFRGESRCPNNNKLATKIKHSTSIALPPLV